MTTHHRDREPRVGLLITLAAVVATAAWIVTAPGMLASLEHDPLSVAAMLALALALQLFSVEVYGRGSLGGLLRDQHRPPVPRHGLVRVGVGAKRLARAIPLAPLSLPRLRPARPRVYDRLRAAGLRGLARLHAAPGADHG